MDLSIECTHSNLSIRLLTEKQVLDKYLPLRFEVLHSEFRYDHGTITEPVGFLDRYDRYSLHYGVLAETDTLLGAARVVIPPTTGDFPSYKFLADRIQLTNGGAVIAELSRVLVARSYRSLGLFRRKRSFRTVLPRRLTAP